MGYTIAPLAQADIDEIWDYTCDHWSEDQADRYMDLLQAAIVRASQNGSLGRQCDHIRVGYFKFAVESHVIFYRMVGADIEVVRILHGRMDFGRRL